MKKDNTFVAIIDELIDKLNELKEADFGSVKLEIQTREMGERKLVITGNDSFRGEAIPIGEIDEVEEL